MILDSSAVVAILMEEPEAENLLAKLLQPSSIGIGSPTLVETSMVLTSRWGRDSVPILEKFLSELGALVLSFDEAHWRVASEAFLRFGKGRHPAALNFGDCMSYATAKIAGRPLLYIGADFPKTDLELA
jgi:ribonuclease VapC